MAQFLLKKSRDNHVMKCYGFTRAKFKKLRYKNPIWVQNQEQNCKKNAEKKIGNTDEALKEYNRKTQAGAFRIPPAFFANTHPANSFGFGCGKCTVILQSFAKLKAHHCAGQKGRATVLGSPGRKRVWLRCRTAKNQKEVIAFFINSWNITCAELEILEKTVARLSRGAPFAGV